MALRQSLIGMLVGIASGGEFGSRFLENLFTRLEQRSASWAFDPWDRLDEGDPDVAA